MVDMVNHPDHYAENQIAGLECIDVIATLGDVPAANIIKYCWRAGVKSDNPAEDIAKAIKYLEFKIEYATGPSDSGASYIKYFAATAEDSGPLTLRERYVVEIAKSLIQPNEARTLNLIKEYGNAINKD